MGLTDKTLSDKMLAFCQVMAQGDKSMTEAAKICEYAYPAKAGHRLMKIPKVKAVIDLFQQMQDIKSVTISDDLESLKGKPTREWIVQKLTRIVLEPRTSPGDKIKSLNLISQLKGYLTESAPAQLTPIILNYEGRQLGSLAGQQVSTVNGN